MIASGTAVLGGRFVVEREVGRGGVGVVYRAIDTASNRPVALKVIDIDGIETNEEARFTREGRILASLSHPNIVQVVAFGELEDHRPFVAMEWLDGEDLGARHRRTPHSLEDIVRMGAQVADALTAAHAAGIVHRDVKPTNIFVLEEEPPTAQSSPEDAPILVRVRSVPRVKLVDFGVASGDEFSTTQGTLVGTPAYMAPEQARGDEVADARADIYSLGATLFELMSGRVPHLGPTPVAILARLVTTPAPRIAEFVYDVPKSLDDLMASMLAIRADDRPASAEILKAALLRVADELAVGEYSRARPGSSGDALSEFPQSMGTILLQPNAAAGGQRLVTSIVATNVVRGEARTRLVAQLRALGAEAFELGTDALVGHLGADRALGDEAARAADLAVRLAQSGASVGIATGRTKVGRERTSGGVVDRAASLARDAQKGEVLLDTTTAELARGRFELRTRSDGSSVLGGALATRRDAIGGAPFVGREQELAEILDAYDRCVNERQPGVVTISGAPGIGKTRLRSEVLSRLLSHPTQPRIAMVECESFAKGQALGIMADVARGLCGVGKGVSVMDALAATQSLLKEEGAEEARELVARLIANQLAREPRISQGMRDLLWISLTRIALGMAKTSPLILIIEDAQWADAESLAWFEHLLARSVNSPVLVMIAARPAFRREGPQRFAGKNHVRLDLRPLAKKNVHAIARAILGLKADSKGGEDASLQIAEQAGGSPLFAEELARIVARGDKNRVPPTIEAAIQVHLDGLDEPARQAARALSVLGTRGWTAALDAFGIEGAQDRIRDLVSAEIIVEQDSSRFRNTREFIFKHGLTREVAYASLGDGELKAMHEKAGLFLAQVGEDDATVARHLELGGAYSLAAEYMDRAARRALAASALSQAVSFAEKALAFAEDPKTSFSRAQVLEEAWSRLDARAGERESAVRSMEESARDDESRTMAQGARLRFEDAAGGKPSTTEGLLRVCKEASRLGLTEEEARCLATLAARLAFAGETERAEEVAKSLLELARERGLLAAEVDAWQTLAVVRQARGDVGKAIDARRSSARAASLAGLKTREATLKMNMGFALTSVGAKDEARAAILDGIALAESVGSQGTLRHGQMNLLGWTATFGADPSLDGYLTAPRELADSASSGSWVPHDRATLGVLYYRGLELMKRGDIERARALLQSSATGYRATNMMDVIPVAIGAWAEAERRAGNLQKARELAEEAAELLDQGSPSLLNEALVFLSLHDVYEQLGMPDDARRAVAIGIPHLLARIEGLSGTEHSIDFLTKLTENTNLLATAETYGLVPHTITAMLGGRSTTLVPDHYRRRS